MVLGNAWLDLSIHNRSALYVCGGVGVGKFSIESISAPNNKASAWGFASRWAEALSKA
jgi:hypothetical protein